MVIRSAKQNAKAFRSIRGLSRNTYTGIRRALYKVGKINVDTARKNIKSGPKTGRTYELEHPFTGKLVSHQASAPGQSPANFSGALAASIGMINQGDQVVIGAGGDVVGSPFTFGSQRLGFVSYASELELDMNRPYLIKAIKSTQCPTQTFFELEIKRALLGDSG